MNSLCLTHGYEDGHYVLPPLRHEASELAQLIDAETLVLHHDKHHAAYVAGANAAAEELRKINNGSLSTEFAPSVTQRFAFHLGGHILHTIYWHHMAPDPTEEPGGAIGCAIKQSFGSFVAFCRLFAHIADSVQGSGWAVLGVDPVSRKLVICGINRHQDALVPGFKPLLACDVWEHAYYLTWRNKRRAYIDSFMRHIDWGSVDVMFQNS